MEGEAVHRALAMARVAGARTLIYHLTTPVDAVRELEAARGRGQTVFGEACLAYLVLGEEALDDPVSGTAFDFSPPLRGPEHRSALWDGLARGTVDIISTDHGPRRRERDAAGRLSTHRHERRRGAPCACAHARRGPGTTLIAALGRRLLHAPRRGLRPDAQGAAAPRLRRRHHAVRPGATH